MRSNSFEQQVTDTVEQSVADAVEQQVMTSFWTATFLLSGKFGGCPELAPSIRNDGCCVSVT
jgi:hypothetical protein